MIDSQQMSERRCPRRALAAAGVTTSDKCLGKKKKANAVVEPSLANRDTKDTIGFASPVKSLARTIPLSQKRRTVGAEEHMSSISFNVFAKQAIYWAEHAGNVTGASPRLPLALCVGDAASKFPPNGCLARPQRTRRTQVKCFSSG